MPIGNAYAENVVRHGNSGSTSDTIDAGANLTEGDLLVLWTFRSNEGTTGRPAASSTGWTPIEHFDPPSTFKGVVDVLGKYVTADEDGTAPTYTVEWNEGSEFGKVLGIVALPGADLATLTGSFDFYNNDDEVTFPADSLDYSLHVLGNTVQDLHLDGDFPAGDTLLGWSNSDSFRNAGFAESGGGVDSGTFPSAHNGSFGTISVAATVNAVIADIVEPVDGDTETPDQPIGAGSILFERNGLGISAYGVTINNVTDGTALASFAGGFTAALDTEIVIDFGTTFSGAAPFPANYNVPNANFEEGKTYEFKARGRDGADNWGPFAVATVTAGTWQNANNSTTATMAAPAVSGTIDSHAAGFVIDEDDTEFTVTGTTSGAPSAVDLVVNGATLPVTDTGAGFDTWSVTVARGGGGALADGDPVALVLEADGTNVATVTGRINEQPEVPHTSGGITDGVVVPGGEKLPSFTVDVDDAVDGISAVRYRLRRLSDGLYWGSSDWIVTGTYRTAVGVAFTAAETPTTYTFEDGKDGVVFPVLDFDENYNLTTATTDDQGESVFRQTAFSTGPDTPTVLTITPPDGSVDVVRTGVMFSGDIDDAATGVSLRVVDETNELVLTSSGSFVPDTGTNHPLTVAVDTTAETWTYGPVDLPAGITVRATIETD